VFETPAGVKGTLTDEAGGKIKLEAAGNIVTMETSGVTIQASAKVTVQASQVEVSAGMVTVNAGMSKFSGVVQCDTLIATTVVSSMYTPGAGNIW
jgi:phage gp45-like